MVGTPEAKTIEPGEDDFSRDSEIIRLPYQAAGK
jgi:hypothetical protein